MIDSWFVLRSGPGASDYNMALDEALLEAMPRLRKPVLRFYGWTQPAASFGYFQNFSEVERLTLLRPLVRRPTGGGIVPHDSDWTYSLVFPESHPWYSLKAIDSYRSAHEWIRAAFEALNVPAELAQCCRESGPGQCFLGYEKFDLLWRGKKIAGAAQRRTRAGLLIQGSVQPPPLPLARDAWERAMVETDGPGKRNWSDFQIDAALTARLEELIRQKYSQSGFNQKR